MHIGNEKTSYSNMLGGVQMKKEKYEGFKRRVGKFETPEYNVKDKYLTPSDAVREKVNEQNLLNPFFGDTVVFNFNNIIRKWIFEIISELYAKAPECFCEQFDENTVHLTLHDLSSSPVSKDVEADVWINEAKVREIKKHIVVPEIRMKTNYIINMNHTSLVLAMVPVNRTEYEKLMQLYYLFDDVRSLPYKLTPHVTLGYYNRNGFDKNSILKLSGLVRELNRQCYFETILGDLLYQHFTSMNRFETIIKLS